MHPSDGSGKPFRRRVAQELAHYIAALTDEPRAGAEEDGDGSDTNGLLRIEAT